ncbi:MULTISPECIES: DUF6701 domain-containing protein [Vibrio]|uniref:DUF6701 domain-containing protein n=1 Tax=Vibrio TaxID=662 RepID=UPI0014832441|nr:DUF6701 domain-containing protein [Vibrio sp. A11]EKO3736046.1 hypothetical protein [Vibrio metschnikovii]EKO3737110.1 hypothetical protein [Vibrio metschnikovii]EKO3746072.1 hypothetical protein [Vibrio metschnikovii]NNN61642.1 hypothetical protein [Vibrio sp. A11]
MSRIVFALLVLLASFSSVARDYLLSSGATSADLPTCSSNNWLQSVSDGIRTYRCANGSVSLSSGDNITATSQAILLADAGFSFAGSNIIGLSTTVVDLVSSYGATSWQGSNNHLFGSYQATNTPVTFNNVNVQGSITTGGAIDVQGGSMGGDVRSNNHGITLENTSVQGAVFANGNIIIDNSSVSGSIETPNNSLTVTDSTITGSLTANGNIMVTRANVSGNITTPHNAITVLDSDIVGSLTANGDIKVTNSELKGDVTTSNNGIVITETNVVGDLSANGNIITDNSFVTGDITSTNNQVTLNNKSYILGNVTAGRPDWGTVNVNGGSTVTGVCQYRTVPDNACGTRPILKINHFRMDLPIQGVTCKASEVTVTACANSNCSEKFTDPVTAFLMPASPPSATGGWVNGANLSLTDGVGIAHLRKNSIKPTKRVNVGVSGSNPTLCRRSGGAYSVDNCYINFSDSGFIIDVPHAYANQLVTGTITALSKGDNPEQCIPSFGDVSKEVALWSEYITPSGGPGFLAMNVVVDGSPISNNIAAPSHLSLYFDQNGQAEFELTYREAGSLDFHARFNGSGDEQDLLLEGQANFIRVPKALIVRAENYDGENELCDNDYINCPIFARSGEDFKLTISPIAYSSNNDHLPISNFEYQGLELTNDVVAPAKIELGGRDGQLNNPSYDHQLGDITTIWRNINEVGVFQFSVKPPTYYWLPELPPINLVEEGLEIDVVPSGPIGRFIPAYFAVSPMTVTLTAACSTGGQPFTYLGQPFGYANNPGLYLRPKSGSGSDTLNYLIGDWWRYDNDWENREYINNINSLTVEKVSLNANVIRQPSLGSGVILNDEQLRYQKPIDPMVPFNADFNLQLSINDLRDSDDVCYRTSYSEDCLGYTFENIDQTMPLYWGRLTIEDVFGPETQGLEQPIYVERYTSNGFVRTTEDNCTALPAITGFILQSDDYVVVTEGSAVPPQVLAEHTAGNFAQGKRIVRFSAPGAGVRGVIDTMLNLDTHNLMWLAEPDDEKTLEDQPWQYYFKDSTQGQVQFGLYRGNDRVIWWRETN